MMVRVISHKQQTTSSERREHLAADGLLDSGSTIQRTWHQKTPIGRVVCKKLFLNVYHKNKPEAFGENEIRWSVEATLMLFDQ